MCLLRTTSLARQREAQKPRDNRAEIVKALSHGQITRCDLYKWGIFAATGALALKNGLSPFARSAFAAAPTGTPRSPLFGAQKFSQPMPRLALQTPTPLTRDPATGNAVLPAALDERPAKRRSYHTDFTANPIDPQFRNPVTGRGPIEGRPPGELFAHQRWDEFFPKVGYVMSIAPVAPNTWFHSTGWTVVTGKPDDIRAINFKFRERSQKLNEHRNEIVLGSDATGEWQRDSVFSDINRLVMTVRALDLKWRGRVRLPERNAATNTGLVLSDQPGQALFKKICPPCHTIGVGDRVGPDLRGVTPRRERAWLFAYIQNAARLRALRDPAAVALAEKYPPARMPILGITENDADDLIAYLDAEASRLSAMQEPSAPNRQNKSQSHHDHHH